MKLSFIVIFSVLFAVAHSQVTIWGTVNQTDQPIYRKYIEENSSFLRKVVQEVNITSANLSYRMIHGVRVIDQLPEKKRGYAAIRAGGPGTNFLNIRFKSARNEKIESILEIYGK
jgi:hypothetical protein